MSTPSIARQASIGEPVVSPDERAPGREELSAFGTPVPQPDARRSRANEQTVIRL